MHLVREGKVCVYLVRDDLYVQARPHEGRLLMCVCAFGFSLVGIFIFETRTTIILIASRAKIGRADGIIKRNFSP